MDGHYQSQMPPLGAFYASGHPPIMPPPPPEIYQPRLHQLQTWSTDSLNSPTEFDEQGRALISPQSAGSKQRKRPPPSSEHVKHRRTRSGCYTCRQRRVKCDEAHPTCERCQKGKRECVYPGTGSSSRASRGSGAKVKRAEGGSSPSDEDFDADERNGLAPILDDDEDYLTNEDEPMSAVSEPRIKHEPVDLPHDRSHRPHDLSPASAHRPQRPQASRTNSKQTAKGSVSHSGRWATLPSKIKFYLRFHQNSLSYHHYAFKYDGGDFLRTTYLEIALNDSSGALLYSIVAFSAYHHALAQGNARISGFLEYYNSSITMLQQSLKSKKPSITTLLTILQLATIEEFLGDWVNLLGHQRAAYQILIDLFTPQTIMQDETRRKIISWYMRFDLFAGMMSGGETNLDREWFTAAHDHYTRQARDRPDDLGARFEQYFATTRLMATDIALLFAAKKKQTISDEDFAAKTAELRDHSARFGEELDNAFTDPSHYVKSFPRAPPPSADDITDFRDPHFLLGGDLFTMNFCKIDWWATELMFKYQLAMVQRLPPSAELTEIALKKCKMIDAIEVYDHGPPGVVLGCQASLGIASLFLPKECKYTNWCRRKFALMEQKGYGYPTTLRTRMTETWGVDVTHWWLPHDEGYPQVVRAVREFIEYRARLPEDTMSAHVRDMSNIFQSLDLGGRGRGSESAGEEEV